MKELKLRDIFPNEAIDFTPWLARNNLIADIVKSINLFQNPLTLFKTEISIGDYRIDMIYRENGGRNSLIVENQYGLSDSKHLGQILVYSSLTHIREVLWICEGVGIEHRRISRVLRGIHIIPVTLRVYEVNDGYILKIHVYDEYNKVMNYKLNRNFEVEYRKLEGC